jgi:diadenylate cyclase
VDLINRAQAIYNYLGPVLDVLALAFLIYKAYEILVKTQAVQLVKGAIFLALIYGAAYLLRLNTLTWALNMLAPGIIIAVAIVFQPELRKIVIRLGQGNWFRMGSKPRLSQLEAILTAAEILSSRKRGALVVFVRKIILKNIVDTGTRINADISSSMIITVFGHDTPLHDGAMVVQGGKILAAGCFLPLSEQQDIRRSFGTRHRAALGLSEEADAVILVVSEETGALSLAYDSKLYYDLSPSQIRRKLEELLEFPKDLEAEEVQGEA